MNRRASRPDVAFPTIFDICRSRPDVLAGNVSDTDFAADLAQVLTGKASADYREPGQVFANTFPTRGLKNLLANVCGRLSGADDAVGAIFRLDTSYGGGKTHGLIALTHAGRAMTGVSNAAEFIDPALLPAAPVRIMAESGAEASPRRAAWRSGRRGSRSSSSGCGRPTWPTRCCRRRRRGSTWQRPVGISMRRSAWP